MTINSSLSQQIFNTTMALAREYGQEPIGQIPPDVMDRNIRKLLSLVNDVKTLERIVSDEHADISADTLAIACTLKRLGVMPASTLKKGENPCQ